MTRAKDISKIVSDANFAGTLDVAGVFTGASLDISGDIDVDGTTNLDVVDIDGAVQMGASDDDLRMTLQGNNQYRLGLKNAANALVYLGSGGANNFRISNSGGATLFEIDDNKDIILHGAGAGIHLGVTSATASNLLDDYEEGSWTPTLGGNTTYTTQFGRYTKIGNLVTLQCVIIVGTLGTGSASTLQGLPFAQESTGFSVGSISISYMGQNGVALIYPTGYVTNNAATINFSGMNGSNTTFQLNGFGMFGNGTHLQFSVSYRTA